MKKNCLIILLLAALIPAFAQKNSSWAAGTTSGNYVIYRDYSWKEPAWTGFLYYDENTVGAFLYTSGGKTFVKILFAVEHADEKLLITGQNIISGINTDSDYTYTVNYLMDLLPKLYSWKTEPQTESLVIKKASVFVNEDQFGGENEITFYSYIPLFHISSILDKNKKEVFKLEQMGLIQNDKAFFDFSPVKQAKTKSFKFKLNKKAAKETKTVDGINFFLDSQWKQIADNSFLMGDAAFLTVNTLDLKSLKNTGSDDVSFLIQYFCSSGGEAKILADKTVISGSKDKFKIANYVYDSGTKTVKYDIKTVIKTKERTYTVISLTTDTAAYEKNKNYFDTLFK